MPFADLKQAILDQNMCTPCGACVAVCPLGLLTIADDGHPVPAVDVETMPCGSCSLCVSSCPGRDTGTATSEARLFNRTRTTDERWSGIFRESLHLTSIDPRVRSKAAAGGAGTSLLLAALRSGRVDAAIVIGRAVDRPWLPAAIITDDEEEILNCAQSSYCITPNLHLLRNSKFSRVALIGVPCEIQALQKMKNLSPVPAVAEKVVLTLEIACASSTKVAGTEHLITEKLGIPLAEVSEMRYRDGEYPGQFTVTTKTGERRWLPFHQLVDEFKAFKTHRCLACGDWWSGLADLSIADGDANIYASSRHGNSMARQSKVMVRTQAGEELVRWAVDAGMIAVTPTQFIAEENLGLQRKRFRYASYSQSMPEAVPTPPVAYQELAPLATDAEVIARMSDSAPQSRRQAPAVGVGQRPPITVSARPIGSLEITWRPPGDKSISQRAAIVAALAEGASTIRRILRSDDVENNLAVLRQLGVEVENFADGVVIRGRGLKGLVPTVRGANLNPGNSATTARIILAVVAGTPCEARIDANDLLRMRPMGSVVEPLRNAGATVEYLGDHGCLPVRVRGACLGGIRHQINVHSAQPVSALLFGALQCTDASVIGRVVPARDHTERLLRHLGVEISESDRQLELIPPKALPAFSITVPGDISAAALPIACTVISKSSVRLVVEKVGINERRMGFVRALRAMGADIVVRRDDDEAGEPTGTIVVTSGRRLRGIEIACPVEIQSMIDELPLLAAVASQAAGRTVVSAASELKDKDTNRIATTVEALRPLGVRIDASDDGFVIHESRLANPRHLALPPDHRVIFAAMALATLLPEPAAMINWERISVSFPDCLSTLSRFATVVQSGEGL